VHNSFDGTVRSPKIRMRKKLSSRHRLRKEPFSALANQVRLDLLVCLGDGEKNVSTLMKELGLGQTLVSHNLRKLVIVGFINDRKEGNFRYYSLNKEFSEPFFVLITAMNGHHGPKPTKKRKK